MAKRSVRKRRHRRKTFQQLVADAVVKLQDPEWLNHPSTVAWHKILDDYSEKRREFGTATIQLPIGKATDDQP